MKTKAKTREELKRENVELKAQLVHNYHYAQKAIEKASTDNLMGSACVLHLTVLGGREIYQPFAIRDGLSAETITAIKNDLKRSYDLAVSFKPV